MADIELVIKIPEEIYELCKRDKLHYEDASLLEYSVANGTPLPKGHGRLLDEKDILDIEKNNGLMYDLVDMPDYIADISAIIEADKESEEQ